MEQGASASVVSLDKHAGLALQVAQDEEMDSDDVTGSADLPGPPTVCAFSGFPLH